MKNIIIIFISFIAITTFAKEKSNLDLLFDKIMASRNLQRTRLIQDLAKLKKHKKIVKKVKEYLSKGSTEEKEVAAEISGIIRDKSYEALIKKNLKTAKDYSLINSLIFSIGENKFHKAGKLLCKYVNDRNYKKASYFALIKLSDNLCYKEFNKILNKGSSDKKKLSILELIIKTKNKKYTKTIKKIFKRTKSSTLKHSSAIALLVLENKSSIKYIKNYLNKELDSERLKLKAYREMDKLLDKKNKNADIIFLNGINDTMTSVKLFSIATMVKNGKYNKINKKDIDFMESFYKSDDSTIYVIHLNYKNYLKKHKNRKTDNDLAAPK